MAYREKACSDPGSSVAPMGDWLPYQHVPIGSTKSLQARYATTHKDSDWFLQLVAAMEGLDPTQSKILQKFYFFLRDFIPQGLNNGYAHIRGNDVMEYLLCHAEHTVSRHKVTKNAEIAFAELEKWKAKGKNWQEAQKVARTDSETRKRKSSVLAPGLHSPAGLLAILILAHPDDGKFRNWIGRLQIDWMIRRRDTLDVPSGFWAGINQKTLFTVFAQEEVRKAKSPMLADYTNLFREFTACRKDIRPFLKPWASHISLVGAPRIDDLPDINITGGNHSPSTNDGAAAIHETTTGGGNDTTHSISGTDNGSIAGARAATFAIEYPDEAMLRKLLYPPAIEGPRDLEDWLVDKLTSEDEDMILSTWCRHWGERIEAVINRQEQDIIQSLFFQSLHRVMNAHSFDVSLAEASMLVDMGMASLVLGKYDMEKAQRRLGKLPGFRVCSDASENLLSIVSEEPLSQAAKDYAAELMKRQAYFFYDFNKTSLFYEHLKKVMALEAGLTHLAIHNLLNPAASQPHADFWRDKRDTVLSEEVIETLALTYWQQRSVLAGDSTTLTEPQTRVFRQKFCPELKEDGVDLSIQSVKAVSPKVLRNSSAHKKYPSLYKLFGVVDNAPSIPITDLAPNVTDRQLRPTYVQNSFSISSRSPSPPNLPSTTLGSRKSNAFGEIQVLGSLPLASATTSSPEGGHLVPAKRPCDEDHRPSKVPKLLTTADLTEGLTELETKLQANIVQLTKLSDTMITETKVEAVMQNALKGFSRLLEVFKDQVRTELQDVLAKQNELLEPLKLFVETSERALGEQVQVKVQDALKVQRKEWSQELAVQCGKIVKGEVQPLVESTAHVVQAQDALKTQVDDAVAQVIENNQKANALPKIGEAGYLAKACPGPPEKSQRAYESALLVAASYYVTCVGSPVACIEADARGLEMTMARFPDLSEPHVVSAIEHVSYQIYGCALSRKKSQ